MISASMRENTVRGGRSPTLAISMAAILARAARGPRQGILALDFLSFRNRRAQADGEIVSEMIAADGMAAVWRTTPARINNHFGGAAADIEQASAEFALVLSEAGFGGRRRLENRIADTNAGAIHRGDDILRGGGRGGDDVDVRFEALARPCR